MFQSMETFRRAEKGSTGRRIYRHTNDLQLTLAFQLPGKTDKEDMFTILQRNIRAKYLCVSYTEMC